MGLGPPVCQICEVIMTSEGINWHCPKCGAPFTNDGDSKNLWELPLVVQEEYEQNTKKLKVDLHD